MRRYIFKYPALLAAYVFALLVNQTVVISVALFLQYVLDAAAAADGGRLKTAGLIGLCYCAALFCVERLRRRIASRYMYKTLLRLKSDLFSGIFGTQTADSGGGNSALYMSIMSNDINLVETNYFTACFMALQCAFSMAIALGMLLWLNPLVAAVTIALSLIPLSLPVLFGKKLGSLQGNYSRLLGKFTEKIKDFLEGIEVIRTFGIERNAERVCTEAADNAETGKYHFNKANADVNALANMLSVGVQFAIFLVSGYFVIRGDLTVGVIVAVTQLSGNIIAPVMQITQQRTLIASVKPVNGRVIALLRPDETSRGGGTARPLKQLKGLKESIAVQNLTFSYNGVNNGADSGTKNCLNGVSYTFKKGGKYAIVGGSGSGKSTLLRLLTGYAAGPYENYGGAVLVDGVEARDIQRESLYKIMSMMHQNVFLFDDTLRNNITLYNDYTDDEFNRAVNKAGLDSVISALKDGAVSLVGESGRLLSGGERQRVTIARSLIKGCDVLALDEATANLDNETAYRIEKSLIETPGLTVIFVTHRYTKELLRACDGILVMRGGELAESGSFDRLYTNKGYFYSLFTVAGSVFSL
ncbi:ABC transporter permease [Spirochaetia bacterium]|nr:ABC transporter permease [Spirochaetia bacterium]